MSLNEPSSIFFLLHFAFCERACDWPRLNVEVFLLFLFFIGGFLSIISETATCQKARMTFFTLLPIYVPRGIKRVLELAFRMVYVLLGLDLIFELFHLFSILLDLLGRCLPVRLLRAVSLPLCEWLHVCFNLIEMTMICHLILLCLTIRVKRGHLLPLWLSIKTRRLEITFPIEIVQIRRWR